MFLKLGKSLAKIFIAVFIALLTMYSYSSSQTIYPNLTGRWIVDGYGVWYITQSEDNRLTVEVKGRGPFQGWFKDKSSIAVSFYDDKGCCTGQISRREGKMVINWSNGSEWVKD